MTEQDRLRLERKGAAAVLQAITEARARGKRPSANDLVWGIAEHKAQQVVNDYTTRIEAPRPRALPLEVASCE